MAGLRCGRYWLVAGLLVATNCSSSDRNFANGDSAGGDAGDRNATDDGGETGTGEAGAGQLAGEGGASSLAAVFRVVSTVPEADATDVERDGSIRVTFSAPVDPGTVSDDSFRLMGPEGPVVGKLEVIGTEVVLAPTTALSLYADYEIELSADLAATDGDALKEAQRFTFTTRDGAFGQAKRLTSGKAQNLALQGTPSGHVVVYWSDAQASSSKVATFFNPNSGTWSSADPIETEQVGDYGSGCVALNDVGDAFTLLGFNAPAIWNRAKQATWGTAQLAPSALQGACALADDGTAMAIWEGIAGNEWTVSAQSLSPTNEWSSTKLLQSKARAQGVLRYGEGFLAIQELEGGGTVYSQYDRQLGWLPLKPVTEPGVNVNYWSLAALSPAALMSWNGPGGRVHVSSFDGKSWSSYELGPGLGGTLVSISTSSRLAGWIHQGSAYVAQGAVDGTWQDPLKLGATNSEDYGPALTVDPAGNALGAWPDGSAIAWRRAVRASSEWSEVEEMADQDPDLVLSTVDSGGAVTLIWQNPLGVWASRFE